MQRWFSSIHQSLVSVAHPGFIQQLESNPYFAGLLVRPFEANPVARWVQGFVWRKVTVVTWCEMFAPVPIEHLKELPKCGESIRSPMGAQGGGIIKDQVSRKSLDCLHNIVAPETGHPYFSENILSVPCLFRPYNSWK